LKVSSAPIEHAPHLSSALAHHRSAQALDCLAQLVVLDALHHAFELAGGFAFQRRRGAGAADGL
jgi:hypothetical protein